MRFQKLRRFFLLFMIALLGVLVLFFIAINLPFSHRFVTRQVNQVLLRSNVPIHISSVRKILPRSVNLQGALLADIHGDTIIYAGKLQADCRLLPLLRNKAIFRDVELDRAIVHIMRNDSTQKHNIAAAFPSGNKSGPSRSEKENSDWEISISKAGMSNILFLMTDSVAGIIIDQDIEGIKLRSFRISIHERNILLKSIDLNNTDGFVKVTPPLPEKKEKTGATWNFGIRDVLLAGIDFSFLRPADSLRVEMRLGEGRLRVSKMDPSSKFADVKKISLKDATTSIQAGRLPDKPEDNSGDTYNTFIWSLLLEALEVENVSVQFFAKNEPDIHPAEPEVIYTGIDMNVRDFRLDQDHAGMKLKEMNFDMSNGFSLKNMRGELDSDTDHTRLSLDIETANSRVGLEGAAEERFLDLIFRPGEVQKASLDINRSLISLKDFSYFLSDLQESPLYAPLSSSPINTGGSLIMENSVLSFPEMTMNQARNFNIAMEGSIENPFLFPETKGELGLEMSDIDQDWLQKLAAGFGIEDSLPDLTDLIIHCSVSDSLSSPHFNIALLNAPGSAGVNGFLDFENESFYLDCSLESVALGELLFLPEMGSFTGKGEIKGAGFSKENLNASYFLQVDTLGFNGYDYSQTLLVGSIRPGKYELNLVAKDSSLQGDINVRMDVADSSFNLNGEGIIFVRPDHLHFYNDTLAIETRFEANLTKKGDEMESEIRADEMTFTSPTGIAEVQQFNASFKTDTVMTELNAESDFFNIDLHLSKPFNELDSLGRGYKQYFASFSDPAHIHAVNRLSGLPEISVTGALSYHKVLDIILPDTGLHFKDLDISLIHNPDENKLNTHIKGDEVSYKMVKTGKINASITDSSGIINFKMDADNALLYSGPGYTWQVNGDFTNRSTLTSFSIYDTLKQTVYSVEVAGKVDSNRVVLEIPSQQFILNREQWKMDSPDLLSFDMDNRIVAPALRMCTDDSFLHMYTLNHEGLITYKLDLDHVELFSLLRRDLIPGRPGGNITGSIDFVSNDDLGKKIAAGLQLSKVRYSGQDFNDIALDGTLSLGQSDDYSIDLLVLMDSSKFELNGEKTKGRDRILHSEFFHFPVKTIGPFTKEYISDVGGFISGDLNISTHKGIEQFNGEIRLEDTHLKVNMLNTSFRIPHQRILIADERMVFKNFTILDTLNKELQVDGFVDFGKNKPVSANLNISSSKLQLMSKDKDRRAAFTGNVFVDSKFSLKGPLTNPEIDGRIRLSEGTEIFFRHFEDLSLSESEKIVTFVNHTSDGEEIKLPDLKRQTNFINSSVETVVEIDPTTVINFTLTKRIFNIDLNITGGGKLQYHMLKNNQFNLSGKYVINKGAAVLDLVGWPNKSFRITEGGYIRWDGVIENPELKFEAVNKVTTTYINPVDNKRREADFNVILQISNQLSDLDVLFTINTPDQYIMSIINTMSPEEKMRQAISILLFEIIDLPGISSSTDYMTQQVNQILASQLNQFTQATIKGVDISFGLDSYDGTSQGGSTETKTSLSYEVRKSLLNNRAQIEFSGRLYDDNQQPGRTDVSMNNLSFEYRLDSAATKYLKVYNEQTYDDVFEGEVRKTGVGFTYRKRYESLSNIWKRKKKSKKSRMNKK